jgi:4-amino-4-deoxy-L-arabinose transferase-like glycosyltransferase
MGKVADSYKHKVLILILVFVLLRWVTASVVELGNDEAYYWLYSQQLQWNYFDHPPMVAIWVRLFTLNGWLHEYEGLVRAGSVIGCAFSTWFLYRAVSLIGTERAGWFAACLFSASLYAGLIAGILIMPDSPQIFFWTLCLLQIAKLLRNERDRSAWILFGIAAGLCTMSKVHGIFLWFGLGSFILFKKREWLKLPHLYIALFISLATISPIFFWNLQYDFPTWRFHSERVDITETAVEKDGIWIELLGQVLINNPFNVLLIIIALFFSFKKKIQHPVLAAYNFIALPLLLILIIISIFRDTWFHWSGPAYITLIPLAAVYLSRIYLRRLFPAILKWSIGFFIITLIGWPMVIHFYPGTYGSKNLKTFGQGDMTLDKYGWEKAGEYFAEIYQQQIQKGTVPAGTPIICPTWWGAHVEYYFAMPAEAPMIGLGKVNDLHQYAWLNPSRIDRVDMDTAFYILPSFEETNMTGVFEKYYKKQELTITIPVFRRGKFASEFNVYRLTGWKGEPPPADEKILTKL